MIRVAVLVLAVAVGLVLAADKKTDAGLAGSYAVVALFRDGKDAPADVVAGATATVTADEITFTIKGKALPAKVTRDESKAPARIDLTPSDGPEKGRTFTGIYKVEKGELVIAFAEKGDRPADFAGGADVTVVRLKRDAAKK